MRVIEIPRSLDYRNVEDIYEQAAGDDAGPVLFDARRLRWIDPNGMLLLLAAGQVAARSGTAPRISLPARQEVTGYLERMGFHHAAAGIFRSGAGTRRRSRSASDVLLEITPVTTNSDVHDVVDRVQARAGAILSTALRYPRSAVVQFSVILSEVCQNIVEHAEAPGWVAAQAYNWQKRLGRHVAVIAVSDLGCGFRASLEAEHAARFGDRWGDATALEAAFLLGLTRFADTGRGQGIQQIRKQVGRWQGILSIRSGTVRIADTPDWSSRPPLEEGLTHFPGSQINIILPERTG
jgi:anti-sigma regulatory factor (Ser/Thr protein kinase)